MKKHLGSLLVGFFAGLTLVFSPALYRVFGSLGKIPNVTSGISYYLSRLFSVSINEYQVLLLGIAYLVLSSPFFLVYLLTPWYRNQAKTKIHKFSFLFFSFLFFRVNSCLSGIFGFGCYRFFPNASKFLLTPPQIPASVSYSPPTQIVP